MSAPLAVVQPVWLVAAALLPLLALELRRRRIVPTWGVVAALPFAALVAVYGLGVVELPPAEEVVGSVGATLGDWSYLVTGAFAFLETGAFVGLVAPGETVVHLAGVLAGQGTLDIVVLIGVVWASAAAGDLFSFWLGRRLGRQFILRHGPRFKITAERLERVEGMLERHGGKAVLFGRFVGVVRAIAPFVLGSSRVPLRRFAPYSVLGTGLWAALHSLIGYFLWQSLDTLVTVAERGAPALGGVIVLVVGIVVAVQTLRQPERRAQIRVRVEAARTSRVGRALRPLAGPARFLRGRLTPGGTGLGLELTTLLALLAVGAYAVVVLRLRTEGGAVTPTDGRARRVLEALPLEPLDPVARGLAVLVHPVVLAVALLLVVVALGRAHRARWIPAVVLGPLAAVALLYALRAGAVRQPLPGLADGTEPDGFPSRVAALGVIWIGLGVALARVSPRLIGGVGAVGVGIGLAATLAAIPLVLGTARLSGVVAGTASSVAALSAVGILALLVERVRQNPPP